jgi:TPR repeat protein
MYRDGRGVPRDPAAAQAWLGKAAAQGGRRARAELARLQVERTAPINGPN